MADVEVGTEQPIAESGQAETKVETPPPAASTDELPLEQIQASKHYKSLQAEFTRKSQAIAELNRKFEQFGGPDSVLKQAADLTSNERFQKFMQEEQARANGMELDKLDPEQKAAVEYVQRLVNQSIESRLAPYYQKERELRVNTIMEQMDKDYGKDWRDMTQDMRKLTANLPPEVQNNASFETVEALYLQALKRSGKFEDFAAKMYERKLQEKKTKATPKPGSNQDGKNPVKITSFEDAARAAKELLAS